jgi:hypothetical protein
MNKYAIGLLNGYLCSPDQSEAMIWFPKAADLNDTDLMFQ